MVAGSFVSILRKGKGGEVQDDDSQIANDVDLLVAE
jgi:hypothetical protein